MMQARPRALPLDPAKDSSLEPLLSGAAALAGILGWPVAHSRSPKLHNYWLARYRIDGAYVPLPARATDLQTVTRALRACGFRGANVTIPHKEAAVALCDTLDDAARQAGAVNTLVFDAAGIHGTNTDGAGFVANLRAHNIQPAAGPALLLGAGGAARAIAAALRSQGAAVTIANRDPERAAALAAAAPGLAVLPWDDRHAAVADHALLVNATSLGMHGQPPVAIDLARAHPTLAVADIVYVPRRTPLLIDAEARFLRTAEGLGMLLHQAAPGFARWFGVTPVVDREIYELIAANIPLT